MNIFGIGFVLLTCTFLAWRYPQQALWAFLIYLPFSGTVAYAIGTNPLFEFLKDFFYVPALVAIIPFYWQTRQPLSIPRFLSLALLALLILSLSTFLTFNIRQQLFETSTENSIAMGLLGLKVLLGYIPLLVCAQYLIRNRQGFDFLMRLMLVLVLICCGLTLVQYLLLTTGQCLTETDLGSSPFPGGSSTQCFVGGSLLYLPENSQLRLPGTFASPAQWEWFLISSSFITVGSAFNDASTSWRRVGQIALIILFITSILSGSLLATILIPLITSILLIVLRPTSLQRNAFRLALSLSVIACISALLFQINNLQNSSQHSSLVLFQWIFKSAPNLLGNGVGRATNSARIFGDTLFIESFYPKLIYEIGLFGAIAFLAVTTILPTPHFRFIDRCKILPSRITRFVCGCSFCLSVTIPTTIL
jgi:hypothetical protein